MHALYKKVFRHTNESKQFQTQKEINLLEYCKGKTFPKNWVHIHSILMLDKIPRYLAAHYYCLILGAWHFSSTEDKIGLSLVPQLGMVCLMDQSIEHQVPEISKGIKYVVRTELMYKLAT